MAGFASAGGARSVRLDFRMSGWRKLMNIPEFVATMPNRGLPDFLGYIAPFVEFIGGIPLFNSSRACGL